MFDSGIIAFAFIGLISFASQWLAWRVKLPAILFLLASGLLIGPGDCHPLEAYQQVLTIYVLVLLASTVAAAVSDF